MNVFSNHSPSFEKSTELPRKSANTSDEYIRRPRPNVSPSEIRAKLEAKRLKDNPPKPDAPQDKVEISQSTKDAAKKVKAAQNAETEAGNDPNLVNEGNFTNDPKSDVTKEKLRGLIEGNGFNFSDKERQVLGKILSK